MPLNIKVALLMTTAIDKIHEFDRFGSILGLERMTVLLDKLGNPHRELKVIHVAGTNGKGSVSKFLEEALGACGYKMGLYTSPFIEKFNERIRLGGRDISDEDLEKYTDIVVEKAGEMVQEGLDSPTEFEIVTAIAFLYYKEKGTDITVLEVGLGGKGDSTNVVKKPLASVICSISFDHMDRLGDTLAEIAADKAGIIKEGCPVISNVPEKEPATVIAKRAYEKGSILYDVSGIKTVTESKEGENGRPVQKVSAEIYGTDYNDVEISMLGKHQSQNLKTALAVIEILRKDRKIKVERSKLYEGLKRAVQPGRFEIISAGSRISRKPAIVVDGAHNEAGARALRETADMYFPGRRILLVTGMLADKQVDEILKHFVKITSDIIATQPDNPRRLRADRLAEHIIKIQAEYGKCIGLCPDKGNVSIAETPAKSIEAVEAVWKDYDVVLFAGSLYLIGEIRKILRKRD